MTTIRPGIGLRDASDEGASFHLHREVFDLDVIARFTVSGDPVPKQRARVVRGKDGKTRAFTPDKTKSALEQVAWSFRAAAGSYEPEPDATYGIFALFFMGNRQRKDVDNLLKTVLDALNGLAYADDSQVVEVSARKSMVLNDPSAARTEVVVYRVGDEERLMKDCENCGASFPWYRSQDDRRFCDAACGYEWKRKQNGQTCALCGDIFLAPDKKTYCSKECRFVGVRVEVQCAQCAKKFLKRRSSIRSGRCFCDETCRADFWRGRRKVRAQGTCDDCGEATSKRAYKRCRSCALDEMRKGRSA